MNIVSWHSVLTDHQSYTLEALKQAGNCDLNVYVESLVHVERQAQGWTNRHKLLSPESIPKKGWIKFVIQRLRENRNAVHLFGSPFERVKMIITMLIAVTMGCRVYLISEPYSPISVGYLSDKGRYINWLKAKLRPLLYSVYGVLLSHKIDGVFAISCRAIEQYQSIGFSKEKIFPFGYFVPREKLSHATNPFSESSLAAGLKIIFIGSLIKRKGLDVLINAVGKIKNNKLPLTLDVYGYGDPSQYHFDRTIVKYCGLIPFGSSQSVISKYDVLVLPSRYDGWGVVVNEALMSGVPVICSNQVGASSIIKKRQCGSIFESENVLDLVSKLENLLESPELLSNMSLMASEAGASLSPKVAGRYMLDMINQNTLDSKMLIKDKSPWYDCQ
jgi:glycosyltransferase involved in cell wall biosynthesis